MGLYMLLCVGGVCVVGGGGGGGRGGGGGGVDLCGRRLSGSWVGVWLAADRSGLRNFDISFGVGIAIAGGYLWLLPNIT